MTRRLLLSYLTLVMLVLLALEIPLGVIYGRAAKERVTAAAEEEADSLAAFAALALRGDQPGPLRRRVAECARRIGGEVFVFDADGRLLVSSRPIPPGEVREMAATSQIRTALRGRSAVDVRTGTAGGVAVLSAAAPIEAGHSLYGAVRVTVPTDAVHQRVHRVWLTLAVVGLAVLAAVAVVAFVLARWASRPILELERATGRLADGTLSARATLATASGPPEVRRLAAAFNQTAARLEHLMASQRAFAGEASHQLKTPLAALRLRLDNLEPDVAHSARSSLEAAMTETDRLARMVEGLLSMARLEEHATVREPVDLDAVTAERVRVWAPVFEARGSRLAFLGDPVGRVLAVPGAVEQILDNLLSNALRVSPPGTTVCLDRWRPLSSRRARGEGRTAWVELHVIDEGPGMDAEQRERAFDRFWRAPGAASGGTGLGLALVERLAVASGGRVSLEEAAGGGLTAVVRLRAVTDGRADGGGSRGRGRGGEGGEGKEEEAGSGGAGASPYPGPGGGARSFVR
ncbi:ATP-binding protein [Streptomyces xinghaiensis]|uniref:sensor histidine kinase n=1 Tax=Streptomyces xinghaiensis TaxID=1038928 RepID=UPI0037935420